MRTSARKTAVIATAIAATFGVLGTGTSFANESAASLDLLTAKTACIDLHTNGSSGYAMGVGDAPVRYTVLVREDGATNYTLIAEGENGTGQWRVEFPSETGFIQRDVRACATNLSAESSSQFLTISTDQVSEDSLQPVVAAPVANDDGPAPVAAPVVEGGSDSSAVQTVVDLIHDLLDEIRADISA